MAHYLIRNSEFTALRGKLAPGDTLEIMDGGLNSPLFRAATLGHLVPAGFRQIAEIIDNAGSPAIMGPDGAPIAIGGGGGLSSIGAGQVLANVTGGTALPVGVVINSAFKTALGLVRADVGLSNVDNTNDASKPVSTAQAAADATKAPINNAVFTGTTTLGGDPAAAMHAATKQYVDSLLTGLRNRTRVRVASTANINLAAPGSTIDGVTMVLGDTFMPKNQTAPAENGIYVWNGAAVAATRDPQFDTWTELPGTVVAVMEGTTNADTIWLCVSNDGGTLGTTAVTWSAFTASGALLAVNNLSDLNNAATARTNLGVAIGVNVQAWDADLDTWATKVAPSGVVIGTTDTQILTNKTLTSPRIGTSILDADGNELFLLTATPLAVNELTYANAAAGGSPTFTSTGSDAIIGVNFATKGGGTLNQNNVPVHTITDARATTFTPSVMGALAIDVTLADNTKSVGASTFTYSGTPVAGRVFYLTLTNSVASAQTYTFPSTYSTLRGANITTVTLPASATYMFAIKHDGTRFMMLNEPMIAGDFGVETSIASATTTDLGSLNSINASITGTTTITGLGTAPAGVYRQGRFTGILTFTHNGTSNILPGNANITTAAGDRFGAYSLGSGNWVVLWYTKANGQAVVGGASSNDYGLGHEQTFFISDNSTSVSQDGGVLAPTEGTIAAQSGSYNTSYGAPRGRMTGSNSTVDSGTALIRATAALGYYMPGTVDAQRITWEGVFAPADTSAGRRWAVGLYRNGGIAPAVNLDPENWVNVAIFGKDNDDTNINVMVNDATGLATKTSLGASFPANVVGADLYYGRLIARGGGTPAIDYYVKNLVSGAEASGTLTADLPVAGAILVPIAWASNGPTTASAVLFDFSTMKIRSSYAVG